MEDVITTVLLTWMIELGRVHVDQATPWHEMGAHALVSFKPSPRIQLMCSSNNCSLCCRVHGLDCDKHAEYPAIKLCNLHVS